MVEMAYRQCQKFKKKFELKIKKNESKSVRVRQRCKQVSSRPPNTSSRELIITRNIPRDFYCTRARQDILYDHVPWPAAAAVDRLTDDVVGGWWGKWVLVETFCTILLLLLLPL